MSVEILSKGKARFDCGLAVVSCFGFLQMFLCATCKQILSKRK